MKKKIKELLITALQSGKYTQIRGQLRTEKGFSVLGILCDIYDPKGWVKDCEEGMKLYQKEGWYHNGHIGILPPHVQEWSGLGIQGESWGMDLEHKRILNLGWMNGHMTFKELAEAIQNHTSIWEQTIQKYDQGELSLTE